jgi:hypothetical protein
VREQGVVGPCGDLALDARFADPISTSRPKRVVERGAISLSSARCRWRAGEVGGELAEESAQSVPPAYGPSALSGSPGRKAGRRQARIRQRALLAVADDLCAPRASNECCQFVAFDGIVSGDRSAAKSALAVNGRSAGKPVVSSGPACRRGCDRRAAGLQLAGQARRGAGLCLQIGGLDAAGAEAIRPSIAGFVAGIEIGMASAADLSSRRQTAGRWPRGQLWAAAQSSVRERPVKPVYDAMLLKINDTQAGGGARVARGRPSSAELSEVATGVHIEQRQQRRWTRLSSWISGVEHRCGR